jgi:hypothetical protein
MGNMEPQRLPHFLKALCQMAYFIVRDRGNRLVIIPLSNGIDTGNEVLHRSGDPHRQKTGSPGADYKRHDPKEDETLAGFPNLVSGICQ